LEEYVNKIRTSMQVTQAKYTINGVEMIFTITQSGKVTRQDGTVLCETGG